MSKVKNNLTDCEKYCEKGKYTVCKNRIFDGTFDGEYFHNKQGEIIDVVGRSSSVMTAACFIMNHVNIRDTNVIDELGISKLQRYAYTNEVGDLPATTTSIIDNLLNEIFATGFKLISRPNEIIFSGENFWFCTSPLLAHMPMLFFDKSTKKTCMLILVDLKPTHTFTPIGTPNERVTLEQDELHVLLDWYVNIIVHILQTDYHVIIDSPNIQLYNVHTNESLFYRNNVDRVIGQFNVGVFVEGKEGSPEYKASLSHVSYLQQEYDNLRKKGNARFKEALHIESDADKNKTPSTNEDTNKMLE